MKKWIGLFVTVVLSLVCMSNFVMADTKAGFSIQQVNENGQTQSQQHYDLLVPPGQTGKITIKITNSTNQTADYEVSLLNSLTNDLGEIVYAENGTQKQASQLSRLYAGIQTVSIGAQQSQLVSVMVQSPKLNQAGIVLGAINVKKINATNHNEQKTIQNHYNMQIPVVVRAQEHTKPALDLKLNRVQAGLSIKNETAIKATLQNPTNWVISPMTVKATITTNNRQKTVYTDVQKKLEVAPQSEVNLPLSTGNTRLKPGKYHLDMVATSGDYTWHFGKNFVISAKTAELANSQARHLKSTINWVIILIVSLVCIIIILLILLIVLMYKRRKKDDE
ncbi:DUF3324 domain-containing protein [Weissella diestrammenae]|uniref:DUF3324 domain-containing protein n=1 Tax=Weissella diestrammenae TaxID=1162633 RepID=A0A7G9T770_9LACO|nr:DUF3324 domain-containing protein [Weissella diestrammenae]MCM0582453.1 DUF3324 domain-containing protein [Weissella diestrammenae]QNN75945.1 DUF3324 domain-containing protein [Weissella diestrammenae]